MSRSFFDKCNTLKEMSSRTPLALNNEVTLGHLKVFPFHAEMSKYDVRNALVGLLKLDYLSTTVCQKVHSLPSDAILRILASASCACPRTLRVSAHISREDTQDGVSVGGFKKTAMLPLQLYIGQ